MYRRKFLVLYLLALLIVVLTGGVRPASAWWGGDKPINPEKIIHVSASEKQRTVNIYLGNDQENYINLTVKAEYIKNGSSIRSEDSSLSDGLDTTATWGKVSYISSSKHHTFTDFKIINLSMAEEKALILISAKLIDPNKEKYIEFKETSFEFTGKLFNELTRFIGKEIVTYTPQQIYEVEKMFGGTLFDHRKKLERKFNDFSPNNYHAFAQYKVKDWLPPLNHNKKIMESIWKKFGNPILKSEFHKMNEIISAMTDLNTVSIKMQSYLKNHRDADFKFIQEKLIEIYNLSAPYEVYQPKQKAPEGA